MAAGDTNIIITAVDRTQAGVASAERGLNSLKTSFSGLQSTIATITGLGAVFSPNVTSQTHYLVVGAGGNPCWAFSCYGRKVEKAVDARKSGNPILIVHESDFWDAVADNK